MHKKTIIDFKERGKRYTFQNPIKELKTRTVEEVQAVLKAVEDWQSKGYYVVGYLSYEAAKAFEPLFAVKSEPLAGEYLAYFTVHESAAESAFPLEYEAVELPEEWEDLSSQEEYEAAIKQIHHEIRQGNTYQVNHTTRLKADLKVDPEAVYDRLMVEQGAGYNAFIAHDDVAVISASPELFFKVEGKRLVTRPMKGTTARGLTVEADLAQKEWLAQDVKNRAENMMIVDLLRNDMGRLCEIGSVQVTKLCDVEQYSTVWQMTSTIEGDLGQAGLSDVFEALYPCGSITGAPKISTMSVINQLESTPRGVYCGAIGICFPDGDMIFNVPIRTMQVQGQTAYYGVGGGITWDSRWQDEYREIQQKAAVLHRQQPQFDIITTGLVTDGALTMREAHIDRLFKASRYFAFPFNLEQVNEAIDQTLSQLDDLDYRLKIQLNKAGQISIETAPLQDLSADYCRALLVERPVGQTAFTYFKTSHRQHIPQAHQEQIFYSEEGILQETAIGNLVLELDGQLYTPPISDGCLPGLMRQKLLDEGTIKEAHLKLEDLKAASAIYACNAVRGLYELTLEESV